MPVFGFVAAGIGVVDVEVFPPPVFEFGGVDIGVDVEVFPPLAFESPARGISVVVA